MASRRWDFDWDAWWDSPSRLAMKDYQQIWYLHLCGWARFNHERPGCVRDNMRTLWQQSGCTAGFPFFQKESAPVIACFVPTGDGWLRHKRVDKDVSRCTEISRKRSKAALSKPSAIAEQKKSGDIEVCISSSPAFSIYTEYPRKVGRSKALKAIEKSIRKLAKIENISELDAAQRIHEAVIEFARSPAGKKGNFVPHPATWFNADRWADDRSDWYLEAGNGKESAVERVFGAVAGQDGATNQGRIAEVFGGAVGGGVGGVAGRKV